MRCLAYSLLHNIDTGGMRGMQSCGHGHTQAAVASLFFQVRVSSSFFLHNVDNQVNVILGRTVVALRAGLKKLLTEGSKRF